MHIDECGSFGIARLSPSHFILSPSATTFRLGSSDTPDTHTHRHTADPKPDLSQRKVGANNHISLTLSTRHRPHEMLGGDEGDSRFFQEDRHIGIQDTTRVDTSQEMVRAFFGHMFPFASHVHVCRLRQSTFSRSKPHAI